MVERDEDEDFETWPAAPDALRHAAVPLIEAVFNMTTEGRQREKALSEIIAVVERIRSIIDAPRLN